MAGINTPLWQKAMDAQLDAMSILKMLIAEDVIDRASPDTHNGWRVDEALINRAAPFAWSKETAAAVLAASKSIPLDTMLNKWNFATETVWWWFEQPLPFKTILREDGVRALCFGWFPTQSKMSQFANASQFAMPCASYVDNHERAADRYPLQPSQTWEWGQNQTLGEMLQMTLNAHRHLYGPGGRWAHLQGTSEANYMAAAEGLARFILAGCAWLNQRIALADGGLPVERHARKRYEKVFKDREVRVVNLRRSETTRQEPGDTTIESDGKKVNWSCRWVVDGFWRNQPCGPHNSDRRLTYVQSFLKGPDDKPLRVSPKKVYQVNR